MTVVVEATTSDSAIIIALVAAAVVALVIALGGPDLIRRVTKVGSGGIELGASSDAAKIPDLRLPDIPRVAIYTYTSKIKELDREEEWLYQVGTSLLLHLRHEGVTGDNLQGQELRRYRRTVHWVVAAALNKGDAFRALDLLRAIEHRTDLDRDELYTIATAYLHVAITAFQEVSLRSGEAVRRYEERLWRAARLLERAVRQEPNDGDSHNYLGYIYDELELYDLAIEHDDVAISFGDAECKITAYWTKAVSQLKKNQPEDALKTLENLPPGEWWNDLWNDDELAGLKVPKYYPEFRKLYDKGKV